MYKLAIFSGGVSTVKRKSYPCNRTWRPIGLWDVEVPTYSLDNRLTHGGEISLTPRTPFTPRRFLVLISVRGWVDPWAIMRLEGLGQLKKKIKDSIRNRTRDHLTCSIVRQPTTLSRVPSGRISRWMHLEQIIIRIKSTITVLLLLILRRFQYSRIVK
jgi:hypothetical protein